MKPIIPLLNYDSEADVEDSDVDDVVADPDFQGSSEEEESNEEVQSPIRKKGNFLYSKFSIINDFM